MELKSVNLFYFYLSFSPFFYLCIYFPGNVVTPWGRGPRDAEECLALLLVEREISNVVEQQLREEKQTFRSKVS